MQESSPFRAVEDVKLRYMNLSCGNSFGESGGAAQAPGFGEGHRHTVPPWKFGLRQSDDRGDI